MERERGENTHENLFLCACYRSSPTLCFGGGLFSAILLLLYSKGCILSVCLVARIDGGANIQDHETDIRRGTVIVLLGLSVVAGQDRTGKGPGLSVEWDLEINFDSEWRVK